MPIIIFLLSHAIIIIIVIAFGRLSAPISAACPPCPTHALEATRWHFLPTVGAATSWPPALPVLPPKGHPKKYRIGGYRQLRAPFCLWAVGQSGRGYSRTLFVPSLVPRSLLPPRGPHLFWPCSRVGRARTKAFSFRCRSCKAFSLALRPRPTLAAALGLLLPSFRYGRRLLTRLLPSLRSFISKPKAAAPVRPPKGGSQLTHKNMLFSI